ncbi:MAG: hypothetical protein LBK58_04800 [Prevotellaceae bacterium]|jgi:hypothetical protein|nr:hypothetical protein [Prevotellaceae bacterium]
MSIKDELLKVYCGRMSDFRHIQDVFKDGNISGPLLMSPGEKYAKQTVPFLAVGQQTNGWDSSGECDNMMSEYEIFNVGENGYSRYPFWNMVRKIEKTLGNEPCSCAWTNISKYDQDCRRPDKAHEEIFSVVDNLLVDEIRITKPEVCIFFISHNFDYRLQNIFEQLEFIKTDGFDMEMLCQLKHPSLPDLTFRTYQPQYLRMRGIEESVINFIGRQVKK